MGWTAQDIEKLRKEQKKTAAGGMMKNTPAAQVHGTVQPTQRERAAAIVHGDEGLYAQTAQKVKQYGEDLQAADKLGGFDRLNQWMDADPKHRELVTLMRVGADGQSYAQRSNAMQPQSVSGAAASAAVPEKSTGRREYTDAELLAKGYSRREINEARQYITEFDALPAWQRAARRASNTIGGIGDAVASSLFLAGESGVQSAKNAAATSSNWKELQQSVQDDDRQRELLRLLTGGKTQYAAQDHSMQLTSAGGAMGGAPGTETSKSNAYTDAELIAKGYTRKEIDNMRARIAGTEVKDSIDPEKSFGYQLYKRGQDLTAAAQAGFSPIAKQALGIVSSAGENLAVAAIDPAWVLPVLSAQGGAESMGQSIEKGESAGKTLAGGLAKFGAGWAINSVGAADLAKTMGADYAKDTLAGKLADVVRSVADNGALAQQYPAIANTISGGVDNAMQAFVETYADKAIDAALGDSEAAQSMFTMDTFLNALESGLTGGASGALGGAVGTGLARANGGDASLVGSLQRAEYESRAGKAQQAAQEEGTYTATPHQSPLATASPKGEALGTAMQQTASESVAEQTAVNDDPAVHTPAQNAGIAEYKNSADPKMAEYVDRVRAGEELPPYMVTETSDRMRSAMQELTGLSKVGGVTVLDKNGVQHITNRHGGGDGSADATMKESADVARAAYVLNNFDNAYLATRKAEGYFDSHGKRAPIVIFEKKIDGSHIIVEAVTDTKKSRNYIVSEYLSSVGVPEKEIAKALRPPVDAAESDPRHTSETLNAVTSAIPMVEALQSPMDAAESDARDTSETLATETSTGDFRGSGTKLAETGDKSLSETPLRPTDGTAVQRTGSSPDGTPATNVTQRAGEVNGNVVENAGESVESSPAEYADVELRADMANLDTDSWTRAEQVQTAKDLAQHYRMSDAAVQTVADNMPAGIGADIYAPAAASLYRLGVNEEGASFADALKMTGGGGALSGAVQQVLALGDTGRMALELAYTQGRGEAEHYREVKAAELGKRPGKEALRQDAGVLYNGDGTVSESRRAGDELIRLTAGANGVAAQRVVKGLANHAKGLIQSAAGVVFYAGDADTATVLHETLHEVNHWDNAGGQELIDTFEHYLVQRNGMDTVPQLVES